jgi:hypothetical protein
MASHTGSPLLLRRPPPERWSASTARDHEPAICEVPLSHPNELEREGDDWITREVASTGTICVAWQVFSVGKHRAGELVEVRVAENLLEVWSGNELVKTVLRTTEGGIRRKRAQVR